MIKRCSKCILPETIPTITFNNQGICNFCLDFKPRKYLGEDLLQEKIAAAKAKNQRYDCIVPVSGGRDSTYVLYVAVKKYGLKPIAVYYDNEFATQEALLNVRSACEKLDVEVLIYSSRNKIAHKIVKTRIVAAISPHERGGICWPCGYGYRAAVYDAAVKYKVPLILWGGGDNVYGFEIECAAIKGLRKPPSKLLKFLKLSFYIAEYYQLQQRKEVPIPGRTLFNRFASGLRPKHCNFEELQYFYYVPWCRREVKETIEGQLGWKKPQNHVSTWKADCKLHALDNYYLIKLFNCSRDCFGYSCMINEGNMTRQEALEQEEAILATYKQGIRELLEGEIGIGQKHIRKLLEW